LTTWADLQNALQLPVYPTSALLAESVPTSGRSVHGGESSAVVSAHGTVCGHGTILLTSDRFSRTEWHKVDPIVASNKKSAVERPEYERIKKRFNEQVEGQWALAHSHQGWPVAGDTPPVGAAGRG